MIKGPLEDSLKAVEAGEEREGSGFKDPLHEGVDGDALRRYFQLEDERVKRERRGTTVRP